MRFCFPVVVTLSGYFLVNIPYSAATISKTWIQNNNWENAINWNLQRLPCSNDIAKIDLEDSAVFVNSSTTIKQLIFPNSGSLILGISAQLLFSNGSSSEKCKGKTIDFTGSDSNDWFDPRNWKTTNGTAHASQLFPHQVPCKYDDIRFPKNSTYNVNITNNVTVSKMFISGKELQDDDSFYKYVASNNEIQQIKFEDSVSFHISGEKCKDRSGCTCGNNRQKEYICKFIKCLEISCKHQQVKPLGGCCSFCGTTMLLYISNEFKIINLEQKMESYLSKFSGLTFTAEKTEERSNVIQVILNDTSNPSDQESRTTRAAQAIYENLQDDKTILKIEILPKEPLHSKSSRKNSLTLGLTIGVPIIAVFVIILIVVYLLTKKKPTNHEIFTNEDDNRGDIVDNPRQSISERINPLYDDPLEMENISFENAISSITIPENDAPVKENPLSEAGKITQEKD